jgi:hypothetical protein
MEKFEYKVVTYDPHGFFGGNVKDYQIENQLNQLGNDGWELVGCTSSNQSYGATKSIVCIFKRRKFPYLPDTGVLSGNHREPVG